MVIHLPSNTGDEGLIPARGRKLPHAAEQQGLSTATRDVQRRPRVLQLKPKAAKNK